MVRAIATPCALHLYHRPKPLRVVWHHVWPQYLGGPNIKANLRAVCDTGHYNVHDLLDWLVEHGNPATGDCGLRGSGLGGTRTERNTAIAGYLHWIDAGRPTPRATWWT